MPTPPGSPPDGGAPDRLGTLDGLRLLLVAGGVGLAVDAVLVGVEGSSAILPGSPIGGAALAVALVAGLLAAATAGIDRGRAWRGTVRRSLPQLYPFGAPPLQLALFLLLVVAAASVAHATVVVFTGSDAQGAIESPTGVTPFELLLTAGTGVVWALALGAVLGLRRFIHLGRAIDTARGTDPFGRSPPEEEPVFGTFVPARPAAPPAPRGLPWIVGAVTAVVMVEITIGIQLLETPLGPPDPGVLWGSQLLTLLVAGLVAAVVVGIDRGVRDVEAQYNRVASVAAHPPSSPGFVP